MAKAPAFQFYPSDWQRDLDDHPLEIEGAWIRICGRLYWTGGTATKTLKEWASILRKNLSKTEQILKYLEEKKIGDLVNQNGNITITCRRMVKDEYIRKIRKEAGSKGGNPQLKNAENEGVLLNQNEEQKPTPSSSSSTSSSIHKETKKTSVDTHKTFVPPTLEEVTAYCRERKNGINPEKWLDHYRSNGWKVGKNKMVDWKAAVRTWEHDQGGVNGRATSGQRKAQGYTSRARDFGDGNTREADLEVTE
jgi:hypothetical protein